MKRADVQSSAEYFQLMVRHAELLDHDAVDRYAQIVFDAWRERRRVFVFGNGGSAYTASHHVTDYIKTAAVPGQPHLLAASLVDNMGLITALGNDVGYDQTFAYQLQALAQAGDVAVAISCSGNSPNVVAACQWALDNGLTVVALTGCAGGRIGRMAHLHLNISSENYGVIEDMHMSIGHVAAQSLRRRVSELAGQAAAG